jgi:hypothetical protein
MMQELHFRRQAADKHQILVQVDSKTQRSAQSLTLRSMRGDVITKRNKASETTQ